MIAAAGEQAFVEMTTMDDCEVNIAKESSHRNRKFGTIVAVAAILIVSSVLLIIGRKSVLSKTSQNKHDAYGSVPTWEEQNGYTSPGMYAGKSGLFNTTEDVHAKCLTMDDVDPNELGDSLKYRFSCGFGTQRCVCGQYIVAYDGQQWVFDAVRTTTLEPEYNKTQDEWNNACKTSCDEGFDEDCGKSYCLQPSWQLWLGLHYANSCFWDVCSCSSCFYQNFLYGVI